MLADTPTTLYLAYSFAPAQLPFRDGLLLVAPPLNVLALPITGSLDLAYAIPNDPLLECVSIYQQIFIVDAGAPRGLAMSPGMRETHGF